MAEDTLGMLGIVVTVATVVDILIAIPEHVTVADSQDQQTLEFTILGNNLDVGLHWILVRLVKRKMVSGSL